MAASVQAADLINAAKAAGWTASADRIAGMIILDGSIENIPTPDYARLPTSVPSGVTPAMYPFDTYTEVRRVTLVISADGRRMAGVFVREHIPWVHARFSKVSATKALAYIKAHPREAVSAATDRGTG